MAESRRKADARKSTPVIDEEAEARLTKLERLQLLLYIEGGIAIIAGMVVLSQFLSAGKVQQNVWLPAAILGGILAVGIAFTWVARRNARTAVQNG
ncbi:MAG: hypothetical protein QOJ26_1681 [Thermoplasmata archaeon]|jgi:uncharacterized membrane protein HdeD (DUF308 family)|nr:hypothetical protein [Thermoplasmata archaeon]MEA3166807.1 hypothetical protein [Thermoplasmata archaeon]